MWWRDKLHHVEDLPRPDPFTAEVAEHMEHVRNCVWELNEATKDMREKGVWVDIRGTQGKLTVNFRAFI